MGFLQDAIAIFKKRNLRFIESYKEAEDVYTFHFEKDKDLTWKAGQHGLFSITHKKVKNGTKPFTIASAPSEQIVKLTMKIGKNPSEFKQAMLELQKGMSISMSGPVGAFSLQDNQPSLLIAGGIGITPFRSILQQLANEAPTNQQQITLLYMDSDNSYIYQDELNELAKHASIQVQYMASRNDLEQAIDQFITNHKDDGKYFVAGPKSMVDAIANDIKGKNIAKKSIFKDSFFGY